MQGSGGGRLLEAYCLEVYCLLDKRHWLGQAFANAIGGGTSGFSRVKIRVD